MLNGLEILEPRLCPASYSWTSASLFTDSWSDQYNWNPIGVPGPNDDVFIQHGMLDDFFSSDYPDISDEIITVRSINSVQTEPESDPPKIRLYGEAVLNVDGGTSNWNGDILNLGSYVLTQRLTISNGTFNWNGGTIDNFDSVSFQFATVNWNDGTIDHTDVVEIDASTAKWASGGFRNTNYLYIMNNGELTAVADASLLDVGSTIVSWQSSGGTFNLAEYNGLEMNGDIIVSGDISVDLGGHLNLNQATTPAGGFSLPSGESGLLFIGTGGRLYKAVNAIDLAFQTNIALPVINNGEIILANFASLSFLNYELQSTDPDYASIWNFGEVILHSSAYLQVHYVHNQGLRMEPGSKLIVPAFWATLSGSITTKPELNPSGYYADIVLGTIDPNLGFIPATLVVNGDVYFAGGRLNVHIDGSQNGRSDQLRVNGTIHMPYATYLPILQVVTIGLAQVRWEYKPVMASGGILDAFFRDFDRQYETRYEFDSTILKLIAQ